MIHEVIHTSDIIFSSLGKNDEASLWEDGK